MAKILILKGDRPNERSSAFVTWERLRAVGDDEYFLENYADLAFEMKAGEVRVYSMETKQDLKDFDLVYIRDIGYPHERGAIGQYLKHHGVPFINSENGTMPLDSKLAQYMAFALGGVAIPHTLFSQSRRLPELLAGKTFPYVVKAITGSNGALNYLVSSAEDLKQVPTDVKCVAQPFVPNDFDYRIIVHRDKVLLAYKRIRQSQESHLNNVGQGAQREVVENLSPDVERLAVKAAQAAGRELCGVDVIENSGSGELMVLEVNYNFGMKDVGDSVAASYYPKLAQVLHTEATKKRN